VQLRNNVGDFPKYFCDLNGRELKCETLNFISEWRNKGESYLTLKHDLFWDIFVEKFPEKLKLSYATKLFRLRIH
jgi:hypothetical protein